MRNSVYILLLLTCCCQPRETQQVDYQKIKDPLIDANIQSIHLESDQIDAYIKRRKWPVLKTGTGLRYYIYKENKSGEQAKNGKVASISYEISLLNGDICYSTKETGPKSFLIGMDDVESGLHEGIQYLRVGEKAKIIIPSHLAHGLAGDLKKIPQKSSIVYDVELISLKTP